MDEKPIIRNFKPPMTNYIYHCTGKNLNDNIILEPRIPNKVFKDAEDYKTPRICVADSIVACIIATSFKDDYYVYCLPKNKLKNIKTISNKEIVKNKLVWDAEITREMWILEPILMNKIGKIHILHKDKIGIEYTPLRISKNMFEWNNYDKENNIVYTEVQGYKWIYGEDPAYPGKRTFNVRKYIKGKYYAIR